MMRTNTALAQLDFLSMKRTNSAMRLQKDYKALQESQTPLVGVTACPIGDSIYNWHGNLKAPKGTTHKGATFHFHMTFPQNYPASPPSITLKTTLSHPNVFGSKICLDMLESGQKKLYAGWVAAYTVEGILIQLQSFLFQGHKKDSAQQEILSLTTHGTNSNKYKAEVEAANEYQCPDPNCKHKGAISAYPPFPKIEEDDSQFVMVDADQNELERDHLSCFYTKLDIREATLGIGVTVTRNPRTGDISSIKPTMDLLCMRTFSKLKVKHSLGNERFSQWFPLYFGEDEIIDKHDKVWDKKTEDWKDVHTKVNLKERFAKHINNSLAYIACGNSRKPVTDKLVMNVMPKLIITHIAEMMGEERHISILALKRLFNFIRIFKYMLEEFPNAKTMIDEKIENFIKNPEQRHKDHTASLGDLLVYTTLSDKWAIDDVMNAYTEEQLDRQAMWMILKIPQLDHLNPKYKGKKVGMESKRAVVCYQTGVVGFNITQCFFHLNKTIESVAGTKDRVTNLVAKLDSQNGSIGYQIEDKLQKQCQSALQVDNFFTYYKNIGIQIPSEESINERLRQAVENSRKKGYHGDESTMNQKCDMFKAGKTQVDRFIDILFDKKDKSLSLKKDFEGNEAKWQEILCQEFDWITHIVNTNKMDDVKPAFIASLSDENKIRTSEYSTYYKKWQDNLSNEKNKRIHSQESQEFKKVTMSKDYADDMSWQQLGSKLFYEYFLTHFPKYQDFEVLHELTNNFRKHISCLRLNLMEKQLFKSKYYYLVVIIGKMDSLKTLKIHQANKGSTFGADGMKFLLKAFQYYQKNNFTLQKLQINDFNSTTSKVYESMNQILKCLPDLKILQINNSNITLDFSKAISKLLTDNKNIIELDLSKNTISGASAQLLADGLMRAKQLKVLKMNDSCSEKEIATMIYNLAFSPQIIHVDLTGCKINTVDKAQSLFKLISISGSIESLVLENTGALGYLREEFFNALGQNRTLKYLNIADLTQQSNSYLHMLGRAVAYNKRWNGSLEHLVLSNVGSTTAGTIQGLFLENMKTSDHQFELLYGDKSVADKMTPEQKKATFMCNLKSLTLKNSNLDNRGYSTLRELKEAKHQPNLYNLLCCESLEHLDLEAVNADSGRMLMVSCGLSEIPDKLKIDCKVKHLNLSKNNINIAGAKHLEPALAMNKSIISLDLSQCRLGTRGVQLIAKGLTQNQTIKSLNLFKNAADVDGARALKQFVQSSHSLEFLDIGHNCIRDNGVKAITEGILANKECKIQHLGLRFNFITENGADHLFENVVYSKETGLKSLRGIYLIRNMLDDSYFQRQGNHHFNQGNKVYIDVFEKINLLQQEKLDRSLWISPIPTSNMPSAIESITRALMEISKSGYVRDIRLRKGVKVAKKTQPNNFAVVELSDEVSLPRSLKAVKNYMRLASKHVAYKAGTQTRVQFMQQRR